KQRISNRSRCAFTNRCVRKLAVIQRASLHGGRPDWKRGLATASASCVCSSHLRSHKQLLTRTCRGNNHDLNLNRVRTCYLPVLAECGRGYWSGLILPSNPLSNANSNRGRLGAAKKNVMAFTNPAALPALRICRSAVSHHLSARQRLRLPPPGSSPWSPPAR